MPDFGLDTVTEMSDRFHTARFVVTIAVKQEHKARHNSGNALQQTHLSTAAMPLAGWSTLYQYAQSIP